MAAEYPFFFQRNFCRQSAFSDKKAVFSAISEAAAGMEISALSSFFAWFISPFFIFLVGENIL